MSEKNKFLNWLSNAGQNWAMASDPAVMQASGYRSTPEGVKYEDSKGSKQLRDNLAVISGTAHAAAKVGLSAAGKAAMTAPEFFTWSQMQKLPVATRIASKVVPFLGSMVGGHAVNEASQALTDKTFGENVYDTVSQVFPESVKNNQRVQTWGPVVSEFLNPGYIAGGYAASKLSGAVPDIVANMAQRASAPKTPTVKPEYSNWGGEFVDDVAVNSRQQFSPRPSKLSEAERLGIPKHIRTNKFKYPKAGLSTDANVYMVHRSDDVWPVEGDMIRFKMGRPYDVVDEAETITKYPFSMHFTHGDEVVPHFNGSWDARKVTYLVPYKDIVAKNGAPRVVEPYDTFWTAGTTFGFDKKGVKALTFDKPTYLKLKSLGLDVEFSPEAVKPDFRRAWIKQKSINAGMPVTDNPQVFTPPSELHKMAKDAHHLDWINRSTGETLPWAESAPKVHASHWTYKLRHTKGDALKQSGFGKSVLNKLRRQAYQGFDSKIISPLDMYEHNSRSLDWPTLQAAVKWLGLRGSRFDFRPQRYMLEKPLGTELENRISRILSGEELIKYRKGGKV